MSKNSSFCIYPWMHLQLKPNGQVKPCCRFDHRVNDEQATAMAPYNVDKTSFSRIISGDYWSQLRQDMLEGKPIPGCWKCDRDDKKNKYSMRFNANRTWNDNIHDRPVEANQKVPLKYLELTTGRLCNLKCRTCSSDLSTSWESDDMILQELIPGRKCYSHHPKVLDLKIDDKDLSDLRLIKMTGGEPMLSPNFIPFVDRLIETGVAGNINLEIYTNASWVPKNAILDRLGQFHLVNVFLSIDGIGHLNDYIRFPSKWSDVEKSTLQWLKHASLNDSFSIVFSPTISLYNAEYLQEIFSWWSDLQRQFLGEKFFIPPTEKQNNAVRRGEYIFPVGRLSPTVLQSPSFMSPRLLDDKESVFEFANWALEQISISKSLAGKSSFNDSFLPLDDYEFRITYIFKHIVDHILHEVPEGEKRQAMYFYNDYNTKLDKLRERS